MMLKSYNARTDLMRIQSGDTIAGEKVKFTDDYINMFDSRVAGTDVMFALAETMLEKLVNN